MNKRKALIAILITVATVLAVVFGVRDGQVLDKDLWFDAYWEYLLLAPMLGLLCVGLTHREDPKLVGDQVLRHDNASILEHWTHGFGTFVLLVTGICIGFFFIPNLLDNAGTHSAMNVHFVGAVLFLFGTFYYLGNAICDGKRTAQHLPDKNVIKYSIAHYGTLLGLRKGELPAEGKYFESERAAYILAVACTIVMIVTGVFKALAHVLVIPGTIMGPMTCLHDIAAIAMALFFIAHVFFAAIAPGTGPIRKSMFTGFMSLDQVKKEHGGWYQELMSEDEKA